MTNERRKFLQRCTAATLLGISFSFNEESLAKGLRRKKKGCYCGVDNIEHSNAVIRKNKWNRKDFRYYIAARDINEMTAEVWDNEFKMAFDAWSELTPLTFRQVSAQEEDFDIIISVGSRRRENFGRSGGVLAWAQMPPTRNFDGILLTKFDLAENWILPGADPESGIMLRSVATHEIGHLLGLNHSDDKNALMYPYINDALKPMEDDIQKIQRLYGKPK